MISTRTQDLKDHTSSIAPQVSVVIPAYNQAQFLAEAVESVLAQTYRNFEIIVVDDGSTDETPAVARQFGDHIRYIRQENRGLGGARNTGMRQARGDYIALLDSDDLWSPGYLQTMMELAVENPDAAVYYCCAHYVDADGRKLSQTVGVKPVSPDTLYETLVQANFLIPSTVVMRRSVVLAAGLFEQSFPAIMGCEDWDLWLRLLASGHKFAFTDECLVHYRLHGKSMSADPGSMQRAARAVIEKHFGPDDGESFKWPRIKQRAYGGIYYYHAWTSVLRKNDWKACGFYLRDALRADPTLAKSVEIFYELALGTQPVGYRGTSEGLTLEKNAQGLERTLSEVFDTAAPHVILPLRDRAYGTAYFAIGLLAYNTGQPDTGRRYLLKAIRHRPDLWRNRQMMGTLARSLINRKAIGWVRQLRQGLRRS